MEKRKASDEQPISNSEIFEKLLDLEKLLKRKNDHDHQPTSKPLNFKEACAYLGYAPSYLYKLTYQKIIPHYKPTGKIIFFSKNEIDEWIFRSNPHHTPLPKGEEDILKDPNQIEMGFDEKSKSVKREKENVETEILIEFPLKSRRKQ